MKVIINRNSEELANPRIDLIACIILKLNRMDIASLRKAYDAIAKILDSRKKETDKQ